MYVRQDHRFEDVDAQFSLIEEHALGAWVLQGEGGLVANHIPFLLDRTRGPHGTLVGHVARANPVWKSLAVEGLRGLLRPKADAMADLVMAAAPHAPGRGG